MKENSPPKKGSTSSLTDLNQALTTMQQRTNNNNNLIKNQGEGFNKKFKGFCSYCRMQGHQVGDCPNLPNEKDDKTIICFKCHNYSHKAFKCPDGENAD